MFTLGLYNKFEEFNKDKIDRRHKYHADYLNLCQVAEFLQEEGNILQRERKLTEFWSQLYQNKIDEYKPGEIGFVQSLMALFLPLFKLQPFVYEEKHCQVCSFYERNKIRWPLPLKFDDIGNISYDSLQQWYDWYVDRRPYQQCETCFENELNIEINYEQEPNILIIEFISTKKRQNEKFFSPTLRNKVKNSRFELIATINMPIPKHFTCAIYEPFLDKSNPYPNIWAIHDGLKNQGKIVQAPSLQFVFEQNPILLFYKKFDS